EGLGVALGRAFAAAGYDVVGLARSAGAASAMAWAVEGAGGAYAHLTCDLSQPAEVAGVLAPHADGIAALVYNAHELLIAPFVEVPVAAFERLWRVSFLGAVCAAQAVLPAMAAQERGTVIFSGATASRRGGVGYAAFAAAKFALRALSQSLA